MQQPGPMKLLFALNPISGGTSNQSWESAIREYFEDLPHTIEIFMLTGEHDDDSLRHWIDRLKPDRVVAVGGDGTVQMAAKQLLGSGIALGILPAGSANGMAKELDIPNSPEGALNIITTGEVKAADVIRINNQEICLHLSDIGPCCKLQTHQPARGNGDECLPDAPGQEQKKFSNVELRKRNCLEKC